MWKSVLNVSSQRMGSGFNVHGMSSGAKNIGMKNSFVGSVLLSTSFVSLVGSLVLSYQVVDMSLSFSA